MTLRQSDALERAIEALRAGNDLADVLATLPADDDLRADVSLVDATARAAGSIPQPTEGARDDAFSRLTTALDAGRAAGRPWSRRSALPTFVPRLAFAALGALVIAVAAIAFLQTGGNRTIEAATLEGVVVENEDGRFTVQTLEALEEVSVPADATVIDDQGAVVPLDRIEVGAVVRVEVRRENGRALARRIDRLQGGLDTWCSGDSARCQDLATGLARAADRCAAEPGLCRNIIQRIENLRLKAATLSRLEELRARCRAGGAEACAAIVILCAEHTDLCPAAPSITPAPIDTREPGERLREQERACEAGDTTACRQLSQLCQQFPLLCPAQRQPETTPTVQDQRPAPIISSRPLDIAPTATSTPTATPIRRLEPTTAPTRTPTATPSERPRDR